MHRTTFPKIGFTCSEQMELLSLIFDTKMDKEGTTRYRPLTH